MQQLGLLSLVSNCVYTDRVSPQFNWTILLTMWWVLTRHTDFQCSQFDLDISLTIVSGKTENSCGAIEELFQCNWTTMSWRECVILWNESEQLFETFRLSPQLSWGLSNGIKTFGLVRQLGFKMVWMEVLKDSGSWIGKGNRFWWHACATNIEWTAMEMGRCCGYLQILKWQSLTRWLNDQG